MTTASTTSPLNGRNTMALYFTGYNTKPLPGCMTPAPILSIVVTAMTKPYLQKARETQVNGMYTKVNELCYSGAYSVSFRTYFPVHVPSTSVKSFCLTVFNRFGPKYRGWRRISCSREIYNKQNK